MEPDFVETGVTGQLPPGESQGQVSLPNDGAVDSTAGLTSSDPESGMQTQNPPRTAQVQAGPQPQTQNPQVANTVLPPRTPVPTPPGAMQSPPPIPKGVSPDNPYADHPSVLRAGLFHTIAQALAGGPDTSYKIDPITGATVKTERQLSKGQIAGAIALEALGGAAAGLGVKPGPGNIGRAAAAGYQQGVARDDKVKQQKIQQAQGDFARNMQIFQTNMRMHQNAQLIGKQGFENNEAYVAQYHDLGTLLQQKYPNVVQDIIPESQLAQRHITKDQAIPWKTVPRLDPSTGKQATDPNTGAPQWDIDYMVVDPKFKADDLLSPADREAAAKWHLPGFVDAKGNPIKLPDNIQLSLPMVLNFKAQVAALDLQQQDFDHYGRVVGGQSQVKADPNGSIFKMFPDTNKLADFITQHESGGNPNARNMRNNNPGNLVADASWHGPIDNANLPPGQAPFRVYSSMTEGKDALLKQLALYQQRDPNQTPEAFFHTYDATNPTAYAQAARAAAGAGPAQALNTSGYQSPDLQKAIAANPGLADTIRRYQAYAANKALSRPQAVAAFSKDDPDGGAIMLNLFGGHDGLEAYQRGEDQIKRQAANADAEQKMHDERQDKINMDNEQTAEMEKMLVPPTGFGKLQDMIPNYKNLDTDDLESALKAKGVTTPSRFADLAAIARYDVSLDSDAARVWLKGNAKEMDRQTAVEYIKKFINPEYQDVKYHGYNKLYQNMHDDKSLPSQNIMTAGVASQHMDMLRQAGMNLHNVDGLNVVNRIANNMGVATGSAAPVVYQAMADKVADEVSKATMGSSTPYEAQIESGRKDLAAEQSDEQRNGVLDAWTGMIHARMSELDNSIYKPFGRHLDNVSDQTNSAFQRLGLDTPWVTVDTIPNGQGKPLTDPKMAAQILQVAGGDKAKARQIAQQKNYVPAQTQQQAPAQLSPAAAPAQQQPYQQETGVSGKW